MYHNFILCIGECLMYVYANCQDTTIYSKKVTREEVEVFDQLSYLYKVRFSVFQINQLTYHNKSLHEMQNTEEHYEA